MQTIKKIFQYQFWHFIILFILLIILLFIERTIELVNAGNYWGISTKIWYWIAILVPIIHQIYVWFVWRIELYTRFFTKKLGLKSAFIIYAIFFTILFLGRFVFITLLSLSNKNTINLKHNILYFITGFITPPVIYLFYSVKKYFTVERAYGIDHFDKNYNKPFVKKGIFKYTDNGMYIIGLMALYIPGLLFASLAGLIVALFNHVYIWVHYFCTEKPDMIKIYGKNT